MARFSIHGEDRLYEIFGVDAEILIDHAWGYEPCGMAEIKSYKPSTNSISEGQVLSTPYPYDKAKLIVREMAEILMFRLTEKKLVTESITLEIGYDRENVDKGGYRGLTQTDRYGRTIPKAAHGTIRFDAPTNLGSTLINESAKLFERITDPALTVRRITINANKVTPDEGFYQVDFFTDTRSWKGRKNSASHAGHQEQVRQKRRAESQQLRGGCHHAPAQRTNRRAQCRRFGGRFRWKTTKIAKSGGRPPKSMGTS